MFWACDSTHSWPGVTHSTRVRRVPLPLLEAEGRAEGDVVPVAGGVSGPDGVVAGVDPGEVASAWARRPAAGPAPGPGTRGSGRRRSRCARPLRQGQLGAPLRQRDQGRPRVAVHARDRDRRRRRRTPSSPPMPSLTTISASAPAAAAASARSSGATSSLRWTTTILPVRVEARVVGRRAVAGVDGRRRVRSRCRGRCPAARGSRSATAPSRRTEAQHRLALAPAGREHERRRGHRVGRARRRCRRYGRRDGVGAAELQPVVVGDAQVHLALAVLGALRRGGLEQAGVPRVEHHLGVVVQHGLRVDQHGQAGPVSGARR